MLHADDMGEELTMSSVAQTVLVESALRTPHEEFVDASTHGVGLVLSLLGGAMLMSRAWAGGDPWCIGSCAFYVAALSAVFAASTLSHLFLPVHLNRLFRRLDQGFIYLLIVGTFTPFILVYLRTPLWMAYYGVILSLGIGGCVSKIFFAHRLDRISVGLYVLLGWMEGVAIMPMLGTIPIEAILLVFLGGAFYTVGVVFLMLDIRRYHFHSIWHVLVIAGSACHFLAIWKFVV